MGKMKTTLEEEQEELEERKMCSEYLLYSARYVLHYIGSMFVITPKWKERKHNVMKVMLRKATKVHVYVQYFSLFCQA